MDIKDFYAFFFLLLFSAATLMLNGSGSTENPFLKPYQNKYEIPPFEKIKEEHYLPAFEKGIEEYRSIIEEVARQKSAPNFENTILRLDQGSGLLNRVSYVFFNLLDSCSSDKMQEIAAAVSPKLSRLQDEAFLNEKIFRRIKTIYQNLSRLKLSQEQKRLVEIYYRQFINHGSGLNAEEKKRLTEINEELTLLSLKFAENVLKETDSFKLIIERREDLEGLPEEEIRRAAILAESLGLKGKWAFSLQKQSLLPFLKFNKNRQLREKIYRAYLMRGNNNNEYDNKEIIKKIISLRIERSKLLGFSNHAAWALQETMARKPENVMNLLQQLWQKTLPLMQRDREKLQQIADQENAGYKIAPWDWWYYAEKLRQREYELDESILKPYFRLKNVISGVFLTAKKLYGLKIVPLQDVPLPHPDAQCFEVREENDSLVGILITDFYARSSKRSGAWMNVYRDQYFENGKDVRPIVTLVTNFAVDTDENPALLSFDEVTTLFHEFGHCLHGLLSRCRYRGLSGTNVPRDFVELPSQIMENWALEPEVLKYYAFHYQTGEVIPDDLIARIKKSSYFNQGFELGEYLAAAILDMRWHLLEQMPADLDVNEFEENVLGEINLIPEILPRYRTTYFNHIFYSGYDAGYYSYIWSEVLDADAFEVFKEKGIFDQETAHSFRKNILERGNSEESKQLYFKFRQSEPSIQPLLKKKGLNDK